MNAESVKGFSPGLLGQPWDQRLLSCSRNPWAKVSERFQRPKCRAGIRERVGVRS